MFINYTGKQLAYNSTVQTNDSQSSSYLNKVQTQLACYTEFFIVTKIFGIGFGIIFPTKLNKMQSSGEEGSGFILTAAIFVVQGSAVSVNNLDFLQFYTSELDPTLQKGQLLELFSHSILGNTR
ncbi:hypothetical protein KIL84_020499 [Mauremys mutica]|uniref:Uncharacterized protein n=1 Tax=Mauremys mutica TaxID=74926 RepID=A0A9D3XYX9_9SAUR|nr:hypothetical protein KIL84_020499 [Mauremys mutica]